MFYYDKGKLIDTRSPLTAPKDIVVKVDEKDIAPVKKTSTSKKKKKKKDKWYEGYLQGGAFDDGYQFGDITKTITASSKDLKENFTAGILGMGEQIVDAGATVLGNVGGALGADDFKKKTEEFIKKDLYDEKKVARNIVSKGRDPLSILNPINNNPISNSINNISSLAGKNPTVIANNILNGKTDNSILGDKTDSLIQSGGQLAATAGLQAVGVPWYLTTGTTAFGGQAETALKEGATLTEATGSALISAGAEVLFEKLGGGINFKGGKTTGILKKLAEKGKLGSKTLQLMQKLDGNTLDDLIIRPLTEKISNKILRASVNLGLDAGGEGIEEVLTSIASRAGTALYKEDNIEELLWNEEAMDEYIDSFVGGALMGGVSGVGKSFSNNRTSSEQSLIDSLVEEQTTQKIKEKAIEDNVNKIIQEREEAQGGVLSEKNKQALRKTVMDKIDSGEIDISSNKLSNKEISDITKKIEQSLKDGKYELSKIEDILTSEQTKQIKELEEKLKNTKDEAEISNIQNQLSKLKNDKLSALQSMTKNNRYLNNAIYERQQSQKAYEYDESKVTDEYEKGTRESAKTHLNNSKQSKKLVDIMSKLAKDRQTNYRFTNKQELKEQGDLVENENLTTEEKTKINNLEKQLKDATTKEEKQYIQDQIDNIKYLDVGGFVRKNADGVETVTINAESSQSINTVVGHETKHLLEKHKDLNEQFDKLLFDYAKSKGDYDVIRKRIERIYEGKDNVNIDSELSAELTGRYLFTDDKFIESLINDNKNPKKQTIVQKIKELIDDLVVRFKGTEQEKQLRQVQKKFKELYNQNEDSKVSSKENAYKQTSNKNSDTKHSLSDGEVNIHELKQKQLTIVKESNPANNDYNAWIRDADDIMTFEEALNSDDYIDYKGEDFDDSYPYSIAEEALKTGKIKVYSSYPIEQGIFVTPSYMEAQSYAGNGKIHSKEVNLTDVAWLDPTQGQYAKVEESKQDNAKFSLSEDSNGRKLSDEQKEYFKDTKVVDENGNLKVMYHGTSNGGHTVFDIYGSNFGLFGQGAYFTDNKSVAESYTDKGKGNNKQVYEAYLNIKNPMDMDAQANVEEWQKAFPEADFSSSKTNEDCFKAMKEYFFDNEYTKSEAYEEAMDAITGMGYDGITHIGGGRFNKADGTRHRVYIAYEPEQVKNIDNTKPTSSADIRYSLSSDSDGKALTKEQQIYFKDSKMRDDNGNLLVMYHGSRSGGFTVFDPKASDDNRSFFFSDKPSVASSYSDSENEIAPTGKEETKGLYKTYLNLKNPYIVDAKGNKWNNIVEHKEGDEFLSYIGQYMDIVTGMDSSLGLGDFLDSMNGDLVGSTEYAINELYIDEDTEESILTDDEQTKLREIAEQIDEIYNKWNEDEHLDEDGYGMSFEDYVRDNYNPKKTRQIAKEAQEKGYDGVIFKNLVDVGKFADMTQRNYEESTVAVAFDSNQIKSVTNETPTTDADIRFSLSKKGEQLAPYGNFNIYGKDVALQPKVEDAAPVQENVEKGTVEEKTNDVQQSQEEFERVVQSYMDDAPGFMFNEDDIRAWAEEQARQNPQGATPKENTAIPESPLEERDIEEVGNRKIKAYMYENPEVKPFFQEEALNMLSEYQNTTRGERLRQGSRYGLDEYEIGASNEGWYGTKRHTSKDIAYLRDELKIPYDKIEKGLRAIIEDHGAENNAVSKRIEFILDERLREGYTDFMTNEKRHPNQDYINLLNEKQITEYSDEAFNNWMQNSLQEDIAPTQQEDIVPVQQEDIAPIKQEISESKTLMPESNMKSIYIPSDNSLGEDEGKQRKWAETSTESEVVGRKILPEDLDQDLITYEPISNKETLNNANARLERKGYEKSVEYFNNKFEDKEISLDDIVLGERLIQEAVKKGDMKTAGELIQNVAILGTELGQKVQALSIIQRLTPEGQLKMLTKVVERGKDKGDKTFEGVEITQEMIDHILKTYGKDGTYNQDELNQAVEEVKQKIADQMKVTTAEKINAWRYLSMLGNAKTHGRNLISNVGMKGTMAVKDAIARIGEAGYDKLSKKITFIAPIETRTKTWKAASEDVKEFAKQTTKEMKDILADGSKYSETSDIKAKRQIFKNKILNGIYEFNSDLLAKEDWWFQGSSFNKVFSEYLTANGINTKEDIENNAELIEKAKVYATEQSEIATFKQYSFLANELRKVENRDTKLGIAVGALLPFKQTPINIAKVGLNYSPIGAFKTIFNDIPKVQKGNMEASEMIDHLSQNLTGTGLALAGYMLAMSGFLNGAGKEDKEGKFDYQLGKQTYSVNIGGKTYSLNWLTPMAMPLFVGANAFEILTEQKEWDGNVVIDGLAQTLDPMSEMSLISGIIQTLHSFAQSGDMGKLADMVKTTGQNYIGQFIPTLSSQLATYMDDTQRSTKVAGDSGFDYLEETVNKLKLKIPGLRETLEPTTDVWGNEVKLNENKMEKVFESFIAPYSRKENIATEIDKELKDLYADTGDGGLFPQIPRNSVNYQGEKYDMSAKEYTEYKKTYGQNALELMEELFKSTTYQNANATDKAEMVDKVYDYASDEAKREYLAKQDVEYTNATKDGEAYYKENTIKGAIDNDMPLEEFDFYNNYPEKYEFLQTNNISYKEYSKDKETREAYNWAFKNPDKYTLSKAISNDFLTYNKYKTDISKFRADKDKYGNSISGTKKEKVLNYINGLDAEYGEKLILYKSIYNADDTYNYEIIDYLNNRDDITYDEMNTILKQLGFTVKADGTIYWN